MFCDFDESVKSEVTLGTDNKVLVTSKRKLNRGDEIYLDVNFGPRLKHNLISK